MKFDEKRHHIVQTVVEILCRARAVTLEDFLFVSTMFTLSDLHN